MHQAPPVRIAGGVCAVAHAERALRASGRGVVVFSVDNVLPPTSTPTPGSWDIGTQSFLLGRLKMFSVFLI